ncbi:Nicastrin-domain-containing protein [Haematococcus lacustris]
MEGRVLGILVLFSTAALCTASSGHEFSSVGGIKAAMYATQAYYGGCYKLLNRTGPVGCAAPSGEVVEAVLLHYKDMHLPLAGRRAVLVGAVDAQALLLRLQGEASLLSSISMVLVADDGLPASESSALHFPGGPEYAPYNASDYVWNPYGSGSAYSYLPIPVFKINSGLVQELAWRATYNNDVGFKGSLHWAQAQLTMYATQPNSTACLMAGTCQALGGFSVWAALPPLPTNTSAGLPTRSGLPVTLVTAQLDSNAFFHDHVQAANAPLSGLLAMLAAMDILKAANTTQYTRQLVFAGLAAEPWGYLGSKRLAWESVRGGSIWTPGLTLADVDQVIEVGPLGRALQLGSNTTRLFMHSQPAGSRWGDASPLMTALQDAGLLTSGELPLNLTAASAGNPGVPPSSLFSFLRAKPSIAGVVITEFDSQMINPYFHSAYDNASWVAVEPIMVGAALLARALHALAAPPGAPPLQVNMSSVRSLVQSLAACLVMDTPGMACPLATALLNPDFQITDQVVSYAVKHYPGPLQFIHPTPSEPYYKKTLYRFLWNWMGLTSAQLANSSRAACAFQANQCPAGEECIGWKGSNTRNAQLMGSCMRTTVRYTPAMPTGLDFIPQVGSSALFYFTNASDAWQAAGSWPPEPLWTESNWPNEVPFLRVLQRETPQTERAIIIAGVLISVGTYAFAWLARTAFEKTYFGGRAS